MKDTVEQNGRIVKNTIENKKITALPDRIVKMKQSDRVHSGKNSHIHVKENAYIDLEKLKISRNPATVKGVAKKDGSSKQLTQMFAYTQIVRNNYDGIEGNVVNRNILNRNVSSSKKVNGNNVHRDNTRETANDKPINHRILETADIRTANNDINPFIPNHRESSESATYINREIVTDDKCSTRIDNDVLPVSGKNASSTQTYGKYNSKIRSAKGIPVRVYQYSRKVARATGAAVMTEARIANAMTVTEGENKETPVEVVKNKAKAKAREKVIQKAKEKSKQVTVKTSKKILSFIRRSIKKMASLIIHGATLLGTGIATIFSIVGLPLIAIIIVVSVILMSLGSSMVVTTSPPLYTVYDSNWCDEKYGTEGGTIKTDGAIVCTVAMLTSYLQADEEITPLTTKEWMKNDYYISPGGIDPKLYAEIANKYGYVMQDFDSFNDDAKNVLNRNLDKVLDEIDDMDSGNVQSAVTMICITKSDTILGEKPIPVLVTSKSNERDATYRVCSPMDSDKTEIYYMDFKKDQMDELFSHFYIYTKGAGSVNMTTQGQEISEYAKQYVGAPYKLGGEDIENGIDCSGFTRFVYKHFGYDLPRSSAEQQSAGTAVEESQLQPGDLICYEGHVAIYLGDGKVISAESEGIGVKIEDKIRYCKNKVVGFRRIVTASSSKMIWPISSDFTRLSTEFGVSDAFGNPGHCGIDIPAPEGTPIYAAADGEVVASTYAADTGNYVKINHGNGVATVYMHASRLIAVPGKLVHAGDVIALVGTTGPSTGNHLHFSVQLNGVYVNPHPYFAKDLSWM